MMNLDFLDDCFKYLESEKRDFNVKINDRGKESKGDVRCRFE